jgi:hypothetical protein
MHAPQLSSALQASHHPRVMALTTQEAKFWLRLTLSAPATTCIRRMAWLFITVKVLKLNDGPPSDFLNVKDRMKVRKFWDLHHAFNDCERN